MDQAIKEDAQTRGEIHRATNGSSNGPAGRRNVCAIGTRSTKAGSRNCSGAVARTAGDSRDVSVRGLYASPTNTITHQLWRCGDTKSDAPKTAGTPT
jgi:hypothetical protein